MIRRIEADNYKSFKSFGLDLSQFNVLLGANGAGKSNVIDLLAFIRDSLAYVDGVHGAIEARDGWRAVCGDVGQPIYLGVTWEFQPDVLNANISSVPPRYEKLVLQHPILQYELWITSIAGVIQVAQEALTEHALDTSAKRRLFFRNEEGVVTTTLDTSTSVGATLMGLDRLPSNRLFLGYPVSPITFLTEMILEQLVLNVSAEAVRQGAPDMGQKRLKGDGANLAEVLHVLSVEEKEEVVSAMALDVPGFEGFETHPIGGMLYYTINESRASKLGPPSVSDGTLKLLAFYALYYGHEWLPLLCFEEPENGLHPDLLQGMVEHLRALGEAGTQVIVTTHSPALVDWCEPDDVILVEKVEGATHAVRASERAMVDRFKSGFTLGELWTHHYLEAVA